MPIPCLRVRTSSEGRGMETAGNWSAWLVHGAAWVQVVWFLAACAIGIPWIIWDEIRFRRTAPKPAEVAAYADRMEATHGRDALTIVGKAMYDARTNSDFLDALFPQGGVRGAGAAAGQHRSQMGSPQSRRLAAFFSSRWHTNRLSMGYRAWAQATDIHMVIEPSAISRSAPPSLFAITADRFLRSRLSGSRKRLQSILWLHSSRSKAPLKKRLHAGDCAAEDQRVHVMRTFIGVHGF
jgi:hypothetical protein